jgi:hypothetical protein
LSPVASTLTTTPPRRLLPDYRQYFILICTTFLRVGHTEVFDNAVIAWFYSDPVIIFRLSFFPLQFITEKYDRLLFSIQTC